MKKTIIAAMLIILTLTGCEDPNYDKDTELQKCINNYMYYLTILVNKRYKDSAKVVREGQERQYNSWTGKQKCCWKEAQNSLWKEYRGDTTPIKSCNENNPPEFEDKSSIEANKTYVRMLNLFK